MDDAVTDMPVAPDKVLEASVGEFDGFVLAGYRTDGVLEIRVGGDLSKAECVYVLEAGRLAVMGVVRDLG